MDQKTIQKIKSDQQDNILEELRREKAAVLTRASWAVEDVLEKMIRIERQIESKISFLASRYGQDESCAALKQRRMIFEEINSHVEEYNRIRQKAELQFYYLIVTREALGLRRHEMVQKMYRIPEKKKKYRKPRLRMVESQIKARGIKDERVLMAMETIPRHLFVDEGLMEQAYSDSPLPIGEHQTISQPYIVALMTEALELKGRERVLEIGTGSGYQTAILASLADRVFSVERIASLATGARKILDKLNFYNVAIRVGDGSYGWSDEAPFEEWWFRPVAAKYRHSIS